MFRLRVIAVPSIAKSCNIKTNNRALRFCSNFVRPARKNGPLA